MTAGLGLMMTVVRYLFTIQIYSQPRGNESALHTPHMH